MNHSISARVSNDRYPVIIGTGSISELSIYLTNYSSNTVAIVADSVFEHPSNHTCSSLSSLLSEFSTLYLNGGITSKGIDKYLEIIEWLTKSLIPRDGVLVAVGGGVIGDVAAFVASTYHRGINIVHVPTTTTAMIDSAIGGKTGINFSEQVNFIGSYYNPAAVFMEISFLKTLSNRDYLAGLCEALKMALISDKYMVMKMLDQSDLFHQRDQSALDELVYWSVVTKLRHVSDDPKEKSVRLLLNYGHTFGQSLESFYGIKQTFLRHGEAVALGMIIASHMAYIMNPNELTKKNVDITYNLLSKYRLPTCLADLCLPTIPTVEALIHNLVNDKKRTSQGNRFVLCKSVGAANVVFSNDKTILAQSISAIL